MALRKITVSVLSSIARFHGLAQLKRIRNTDLSKERNVLCALPMLRCFATTLSRFLTISSATSENRGIASPYLFRNFLDEAKLCKLLFLGQLVADFAGSKAALRA